MKIAILMGSKSDWTVMSKAAQTLKSINGTLTSGADFAGGDTKILMEVRVLSAHRTPHDLRKYVDKCGADVFIAGAGGAAHLAGAIAAHTTKPVIGVPVSNSMQGLDALLSTVQMPPGMPVATVGIDRADNAALLAVQMLSIANGDLQAILWQSRSETAKKVQQQDKEVNELLTQI